MSPRHHLDARLVALVAVGGAAGTLGRYGLARTLGTRDGWPFGTLVANVVGALLLGALLEALVRTGPETPRGRVLRLGLGTGVLGGFTTFSSLAVETERLLAGGAATTALGYGAGSLVAGFVACLGGVVLAARHHRWRVDRLPDDPDAQDVDGNGREAS